MNFLAIDTSANYLTVLAYRDGILERIFIPDCSHQHSVILMDKIDEVLSRIRLQPRDCDFFAAVVGPGSFTGIRIGISTIKGFCLATKKPALSVTSFDCIAYADKSAVLALIDAGRGEFYACGYEKSYRIVLPPCILTEEKCRKYPFPAAGSRELIEGCLVRNPSEGLFRAVIQKAKQASAPRELSALYVRKSSAEERK